MMKQRNRFMILLLSALLVLFLSVPAFAVNNVLDSGTCDFDGKSLNASFDNGTLRDEISGLEPGDSLEYTITYKNSSNKTVEYYMLAKTLQTLEDSKNTAENGGYTFVLKDSGPNGETVLFDNSSVGGDTKIANLEGLKQATNATQEYFFIHELKPGQSGQTYLKVALDEETQANAYMDTAGKLQVAYAVEIPGTGKNYENSPKTGDPSDLLKYILMMTVAFLIALLAFVSWRRDRKDGEEA